jgi:hypothetical protein
LQEEHARAPRVLMLPREHAEEAEGRILHPWGKRLPGEFERSAKIADRTSRCAEESEALSASEEQLRREPRLLLPFSGVERASGDGQHGGRRHLTSEGQIETERQSSGRESH